MASAVAGVCVLMLALGTLPVRTGGDKVVVCGIACRCRVIYSWWRIWSPTLVFCRPSSTGRGLSIEARGDGRGSRRFVNVWCSPMTASRSFSVRTPVGPAAREQSRSRGRNGSGLSRHMMACLLRLTRIREGPCPACWASICCFAWPSATVFKMRSSPLGPLPTSIRKSLLIGFESESRHHGERYGIFPIHSLVARVYTARSVFFGEALMKDKVLLERAAAGDGEALRVSRAV